MFNRKSMGPLVGYFLIGLRELYRGSTADQERRSCYRDHVLLYWPASFVL